MSIMTGLYPSPPSPLEEALKQHEALYTDMKDPARRSYAAIVSTTDHYVGQPVAIGVCRKKSVAVSSIRIETRDVMSNEIVLRRTRKGLRCSAPRPPP